MKKLETIVRLEKLEDLKGTLEGCRTSGIMIGNIMSYGNQKGYAQAYRGITYTVNLLPKMKVEMVVPEDITETIIDKVVKEITIGDYGDGEIFIYNVQDAVRIRTGEGGVEAP